jgi:hypothetical protein
MNLYVCVCVCACTHTHTHTHTTQTHTHTHTHTYTHSLTRPNTQVWTRQLEKAVHVQPSYMELERGISGWLGTSWEPYGVFFFL